jgi:Ser/Thr protein kinase RdoA (MazF antagonist)
MTAALLTDRECHDLIALIRRHRRAPDEFNLAALAAYGIRPLDGGLNDAVYLRDDGQQRCCIKFHRTDDDRRCAEREWRALSLLATHRPGLAPQPLGYDPDEQGPAVAMEYLPGRPLALSPDALPALANGLRAIYSLPATTVEYPYRVFGNPDTQIARLHTGVERFSALTADSLARDALALVRRWLAGPDPTILLADADAIFSPGDPNPANWLWDEGGQSLRRIDLEYAGWNDLANDLADLIEGPWARHIPD